MLRRGRAPACMAFLRACAVAAGLHLSTVVAAKDHDNYDLAREVADQNYLALIQQRVRKFQTRKQGSSRPQDSAADLTLMPEPESSAFEEMDSQVSALERHLVDSQRRDAEELAGIKASYEDQLRRQQDRIRDAERSNVELEAELTRLDVKTNATRVKIAALLGPNRELASALRAAHEQLSLAETLQAAEGHPELLSAIESHSKVALLQESSEPPSVLLDQMVRTLDDLVASHNRSTTAVRSRYESLLQDGASRLKQLENARARLTETVRSKQKSVNALLKCLYDLRKARTELEERYRATRALNIALESPKEDAADDTVPENGSSAAFVNSFREFSAKAVLDDGASSAWSSTH